MKKTDKTLWRIYFWAILIIGIPSYIKLDISILEGIDAIAFVMGLVALYGFSWDKKILSKDFWKIYFVVAIGWNIFDLAVNPEVKDLISKDAVGGTIALAIGLGLIIPLFVALYRYAFDKKR